jgi:hypothetical protein
VASPRHYTCTILECNADPADSAFVDRADIKEYVDYPPPQAIYWILTSCLRELMSKGLVREMKLLEWKALRLVSGRQASIVQGCVVNGDLKNVIGGKDPKAKEGLAQRKERVCVRLAKLAEECHVCPIHPTILHRFANGPRPCGTYERMADESCRQQTSQEGFSAASPSSRMRDTWQTTRSRLEKEGGERAWKGGLRRWRGW